MAREMKDSGIEWIGNIPAHWKIRRNKTLFDCSKEIVGTASKETQLLSLTTQGVKTKSQDAIGGKVPESFDTYQTVMPYDIVMCLFDLDCSAVFSGISPYYGMISPAYKILKCKSAVLPNYADYWFRFVFDGRKFKSYAKNLRYTLNYDEFAVLPLALPNVVEQGKIVSYLDKICSEIDVVISKTKTTIEEYKKLKQSIITEAVTKGIRGDRPMKDSGIEWIGDIVETYSIIKLKHLLSAPLMYGANESGIPFDENLPRYIRITDITMDGKLKDTGKLSLTEDTAESYILQNNDVLFARSGASVGKAFIYKEHYGRCAFAGYLIKASIGQKLLADYLFFYTQSSLYEEWKNQIFVQATIQNIGADRYNILPVVLGSIEEQKEIVDYLNKKCTEIDTLIEKKTALLEEMETYKKSVIYEYVTGKKEV